MLFFFFFKQKTAYEMRISDWSSDVCSSDLQSMMRATTTPSRPSPRRCMSSTSRPIAVRRSARPSAVALYATCWRSQLAGNFMWLPVTIRSGEVNQTAEVRKERKMRKEQQRDVRSEEHTSELQSLMRISYAVFCLKKKK